MSLTDVMDAMDPVDVKKVMDAMKTLFTQYWLEDEESDKCQEVEDGVWEAYTRLMNVIEDAEQQQLLDKIYLLLHEIKFVFGEEAYGRGFEDGMTVALRYKSRKTSSVNLVK
jgi:hypothetical protein